MADHMGDNVTLFYKSHPIYRFAGSTFEFNKDTAPDFIKFVVARAQHPEFLGEILKLMPAEKRAYVSRLLNKVGV